MLSGIMGMANAVMQTVEQMQQQQGGECGQCSQGGQGGQNDLVQTFEKFVQQFTQVQG
jgi:hypothetical protein